MVRHAQIHQSDTPQKRNDKSHVIMSTDAEKAFDKTQHSLVIETLHKMGLEGKYLNVIKTAYEKPSANITLNGKTLKPFPLRSEQDEAARSHRFIQCSIKVLARAVRREKEIKGIRAGNEEVQLSLSADNVILYRENPKDATKKVWETINKYRKAAGYKVNVKK